MKSELDSGNFFIRPGSVIQTCGCGARLTQVLAGSGDKAKAVTVDYRPGPFSPGPAYGEFGHWGKPHKCPQVEN